MHEPDFDYELIGDIVNFLRLNDDFDNLTFDQRREILNIHNKMIENRHMQKRNQLLETMNMHFEDLADNVR